MDGQVDVLVSGISIGRSTCDQVRSWNAQVHLDPIEAAMLPVVMGDVDDHAATDQPREDLLEVGQPAPHLALDSLTGRESVKSDLQGCLHACNGMHSVGQPDPGTSPDRGSHRSTEPSPQRGNSFIPRVAEPPRMTESEPREPA